MKLQAAIQGFLMDWQLRGRSPNTLRTYRSCLRVLAQWLEEQGVTEVGDVTIAHLRAFMVHTGHRPASCDRCQDVGRSMLQNRPPSQLSGGQRRLFLVLLETLAEAETFAL